MKKNTSRYLTMLLLHFFGRENYWNPYKNSNVFEWNNYTTVLKKYAPFNIKTSHSLKLKKKKFQLTFASLTTLGNFAAHVCLIRVGTAFKINVQARGYLW